MHHTINDNLDFIKIPPHSGRWRQNAVLPWGAPLPARKQGLNPEALTGTLSSFFGSKATTRAPVMVGALPSSQMGPDQKVAKLQSLPLNLFLEHCECLSLGRIGYGQRTKVPGKSCALEKERGQAGPGGALPEVIGNLLGAGLRVGRWV